MEALKLERKTYYTYSDYIGWSDDTRYELLEGNAVTEPPIW